MVNNAFKITVGDYHNKWLESSVR